MRLRLHLCSYLVAGVVLTVVGTVSMGGLLLLGGMLHGEPIGGPWGVVQAPLIAAVGSFGLLLVAGVPAAVLFDWGFVRTGWHPGFRWLILPFTGPGIFCVLAPVFWHLGGEVVSAVPISMLLGVVVSAYWLVYLVGEWVWTRGVRSRSPEAGPEAGVPATES